MTMPLWKNAEGYSDPTAYKALKNVCKEEMTQTARLDYIRKKVKMLTEEFLVYPTEEEFEKLYSLKSERAIDRYTVNIIKVHWSE